MEESIKDHNGVLPGKTIFFAITQKHAYRLVEVFDKLYPEYKGQKTFILQTGDVKKKYLINAPFTQLHPQGIRGVFKPTEIDEILDMTYKLVA